MLTARRWFRDLAGLAVVASAAFAPGSAHADRIVLRGGGVVQGVVLPPEPADGEDEGDVRVLTAASSRPYEFRKVQILRVERVDDALRQYLGRREQPRATAEEEYQLGHWCEENGLNGPAQIHFKRAVELDGEHAEANKKVGRVFHNGRWMTYDEQRQAMGLVKHDGKWVSSQEMAEIATREKFSADQASWARRLKVLRQKWLSGSTPEQRQEAEAQLSAIRDASAVAPLISIFGADPEPVRARLAGFVSAIEGPEAITALVRLLLAEPTLDVRQAILQQLQSRHDVETLPKLVQALGSKDPIVVGRAAWALGMLDAVSAVPKLVPVLVKVEKRMVWDQPEPQGGMGGMGDISFSSIGPGPVVPGGGAGYAVPGAGGSVGPIYPGGGYSIPVLTGPVVGPGVVAFGATSVPFGSGVGLSTGGGVNPNRPSARLMTRVYQNEEVLLALKKLTGQDFGYDVASWRRWLRVGYRAEPAPERRVPQP